MKLTTAQHLFCKSISVITLVSLTACNANNQKTENISLATNAKTSEVLNDTFVKKHSAWISYTGNWQFKDGELLQASTKDSFPVILNESKVFKDVDVSVKFKPISGNIDASGGLVFRAQDEDNYYIVRANALENNFRLYTFTDGLRHQLASSTVKIPSMNKFHTMRIIVVDDHIQAFLNGKLKIDYHDKTFDKGFTGLWTKADSITAFDDFKVLEFAQKEQE